MKKKTKGIIMFIFLGGIMLTSGVTIGLPNIMPEDPETVFTTTGTPMDNFPDIQRAQFCGTGDAQSNSFVKEFKIPTPCTQPLAMTIDPSGNVWFAQTNTGSVAKFDPTSETFTEYQNPSWPKGGRSMMWGMDYSPDDSLWYTDERYDQIWKFSIPEKKFYRTGYPAGADSLPQRLAVVGSQIIVNDFTGNKITFLDPAQTGDDSTYLSLPSPVEESITAGFAVDKGGNVWYTNWIFQQGGVLVKFDHKNFTESSDAGLNPPSMKDFFRIFKLPADMVTPNGISVGPDGTIWITETSSSFFFKFDPQTESFTKFITAPPHMTAYGNASGLIKSPISRPYWNAFDESGNLIFNEQTSNRIGIFNPSEESLVEYAIPSKNPNWADCESMENCGLAQVFDFKKRGDKIWFTEWVENNIGVVDTSLPLPVKIQTDRKELTLEKGSQIQLTLTLISTTQDSQILSLVSANTGFMSDISIDFDSQKTFRLEGGQTMDIPVTITASDEPLPGTYKVLLGASTTDVDVSKYVTVKMLPSITDFIKP